MNKCRDCKYWRGTILDNLGSCQVIDITPRPCSRTEMVLSTSGAIVTSHRLLLPGDFGCVNWKEVETPFCIEHYFDPCKTTWTIRHKDSAKIVITLAKAITDEEMVKSLCRTLNELWRKDKCSG